MTPRVKRVIFLARKPGAVDALNFLLKNKIQVAVLVTHPDEPARPALEKMARSRKILFFTDDAPLYDVIAKNDKRVRDIDLVISYLFWKKIRQPLIELGRRGCINFHPAPLPDYKSRAGYNTAILDQRPDFGVSAHFVSSEEFDSGRIIKVLKFEIDPQIETVISLEKKSQEKLLELFKKTMRIFLEKDKIPTKPNIGGLYLTAKQLDELKKIDVRKDSLETINQKIRAFFFPPHVGAYVEVKGQKFTLLNEETLQLIARLMKH